MKKKRVIVFAKEKYGLSDVLQFLRKHFTYVRLFKGNRGDVFPKDAYRGKYDICISYMSPWILPAQLLSTIKDFSINFHPGTPDYRGVGCTNFALYNEESRYGVTAHLMADHVDSGRILGVRYFSVSKKDSLVEVTNKCYEHILKQFFYIFRFYLKNNALPRTQKKWSRHLYTRRQLDHLCRIRRGMSLEEVRKRIRATNFPNMPKAYWEMHGYRFEYKE